MGQLKKLVPKTTRNKIVEKFEEVLPENSLRRKHFANIISVGGAGLVAAGAALDTKGYRRSGMLLRGFGETADDFDGDTARRLGTAGKSGAVVDSVLDKIKVAIEVGVLWSNAANLDNTQAGSRKRRLSFIAGKHLTNAALNTYIEARGADAHSSQMGQVNMWMDGLAIGFWGIADVCDSPSTKTAVNSLGNVAFGAGIMTGVVSNYGYANQAMSINSQHPVQFPDTGNLDYVHVR